MDADMEKLIANAPRRWRVKYTVMSRRKPGYSWVMGYVAKGVTFASDWIENNWISVQSNKWIPAAAAELVADVPPPEPPSPSERQYYYILADDQLPAKYRPVRPDNVQGYPMTVQYRPEATIKLTAAIQQFIFSLNRSDNEHNDRMAFQGYVDAWQGNNGGKVRDHYNAITGEGNPSDFPKWAQNVGMAGNVICGEETTAQGIYGIPNGTPVLKVQTIDPRNLPFGMTHKDYPHLIHHCVVIRPNIVNGRQMVNPFPQMGGREGQPCYAPLMAVTDLYIEMYKLRKLKHGEAIPSPYNPPW